MGAISIDLDRFYDMVLEKGIGVGVWMSQIVSFYVSRFVSFWVEGEWFE